VLLTQISRAEEYFNTPSSSQGAATEATRAMQLLLLWIASDDGSGQIIAMVSAAD
jgi:hypothetical protein